MPSGSATRVEGSARGWHIRWHAEWWMLYGTLYVNNDNDITSPIMIVDRRPGEGDHDAIYGPEVPESQSTASPLCCSGTSSAARRFPPSRANLTGTYGCTRRTGPPVRLGAHHIAFFT